MFTTNAQNLTSGTVNRSGSPATRFLLVAMAVASVISGYAARAYGHDGSPCVTNSKMSVMFEPATTEEEAQAIAAQHPVMAPRFVTDSRWTTTASDDTVEEGETFTLTYSFVPDGTQIQSTYADADTVSNLYATMDANFPGGMNAFRSRVYECFNEWSKHTNINYVEVPDDGVVLNSFALGQLGSRGDIRIGMHPIGDGPLAYNFFPAFGGDMVLDSLDVDVFANPTNNFRALRNTLMHEHGHGLGLAHVIPVNNSKLMEPNLSVAYDGPQEDDVRAVQFLYGDSHENNDTPEAAQFFGDSLRKPTDAGEQTFTIEDAALERADSVDWYAFTAFAMAPIAIQVEPQGSLYQFGEQDGQPFPTDAKAARDLAFRIWRRVSSQTDELQMLAQIDFNEAGVAEYHPPVPYTLAGSMLLEVYSNDNVNDVQAYRVTISNSAIEAVGSADPVFSLADGLNAIEDGDVVQFGAVPTGDTAGKALTIRNNGEGPLEFTGNPAVTVVGPGANDFEVQLNGADLAPDGFRVLGISFDPSTTGVRQAVISIPNNDPTQSDFSFIVSGLGVEATAPEMAVEIDGEAFESGETLDFGELFIDETLSAELTIRNTGDATLEVNNIVIGGLESDDFTVSLSNATLSPGSTATGTISATPSAAGERASTLRMFNNAGPVFVIQLSTFGIEEEIVDCNGNGFHDEDDLAAGSPDCNENGLLDGCEADLDGDEVIDACDNCPSIPNMEQEDFDGDGIGDACDNCAMYANPDQQDSNGDGLGDVCEIEDDHEDDGNENDENDENVDDNGDEDENVGGNDDGNVDDEDENVEDNGDDENVNDDDNDVNEDEDENVDQNDDDEQNVDQNDREDEDDQRLPPIDGFCGAGGAGLIPVMMLGLCGLRTRRRG